LDLITCFLYSIHYSGGVERLKACIASVHAALRTGGVFCFNVVDKNKIDNNISATHTARQAGAYFTFSSAWNYCGAGEKQLLKLRIEKTGINDAQVWHDEHHMVAFS